MTTHVIQLDRYCAKAEGVRWRLVLGTWASYGIEQLQLVLGDGWADRTVTAVFHGPKSSAGTTVLAGSDGLVAVPQEATAAAGYGTITIVGVDESSQRISVDIPYVVMAHAPVTGQSPDPTPDQWQQFVAAVKADADRAEQAAGAAATSADAAEKSAQAAAESAQQAEQAGADIGEAKDAALEAIQQAQDTGVQTVQAATTTGVQAIQQAHQAALDDIATDRQQALTDIEGAGDKQQSAITSSGAAALEAIGRVEQAAIGQVQQAGTAQVDAVNVAGQTQLDKIAAANALVPTPTQEDAGKAVVVKADGSGYELGEVQTDAYTKAESDARYAPIEAAIRPTVSGNPATLEHSVEWGLQGLNVYGKSTQDGEPSPENPVPIVSAGEGGSIGLTISNGADLPQSMTISTPNGLPGIPVDSGGNYTDASGQQFVCDVVDFEKNTFTQNLLTLKLAGIPNFAESTISTNTKRLAWYNVFSTTFKVGAYEAVSTFAAWGAWAPIREVGTFAVSNKTLYFTPKDQMTPEEANELFANLIASGNAVVLGQLATPITTPLSPEEIAAYRALHTYDGTTVVSTAEDVAGLSARYVADAEDYIDSKIQSAITQAVTAATALTGGAS